MDRESLDRALLVAPFHQWLRLSIRSLDADGITVEMPWREEMMSNPTTRTTHGGILASLIDLTGFYSVLATGHVCTSTADLHVDYHHAARPETLLARGQVLRIGKRLAVAAVQITGEGDKLLASGRGAYTIKG